jgi:hypothetical protein
MSQSQRHPRMGTREPGERLRFWSNPSGRLNRATAGRRSSVLIDAGVRGRHVNCVGHTLATNVGRVQPRCAPRCLWDRAPKRIPSRVAFGVMVGDQSTIPWGGVGGSSGKIAGGHGQNEQGASDLLWVSPQPWCLPAHGHGSASGLPSIERQWAWSSAWAGGSRPRHRGQQLSDKLALGLGE